MRADVVAAVRRGMRMGTGRTVEKGMKSFRAIAPSAVGTEVPAVTGPALLIVTEIVNLIIPGNIATRGGIETENAMTGGSGRIHDPTHGME